jgi:hypothetical protein
MIILSNSGTLPSARLLGKSLEEICGEKIKVLKDVDSIPNNEIILRYGNLLGNFDKEINSKEFISISGDKFKTAEVLKNVVYTMEFHKGYPEEYPVVIRTKMNSFGGKGIFIVENETEFESFQENYWTPWLNLRREYRVHVANGEILRIFKKIPEEGVDEIKYPIRNNDNGYHFSLRTNFSMYKVLFSFVENICKAVQFDFCAMDIGFTEEKRYVLIELNSAPGLNEETAAVYAINIWRIANERYLQKPKENS